MEHDYRTQCLGGRLAEFADVVLCDVDPSYSVRWLPGYCALRISGQGLVNALVDLPFALPTAVTGIALATPYAPNGWIGRFSSLWASKSPLRPSAFDCADCCQPALYRPRRAAGIGRIVGEYEEAAATLGASRWTTFRRVLLPEITPALLTGAGMMFARSTGEYGSVILSQAIFRWCLKPALIITGKLEQYDAQGASAVALFMLMISFVILLILNITQWTLSRRAGAKV